jgi:hypothetical protein
LLSGLLMRAENADARVVLAFPDIPTFKNLAIRITTPLSAASIEVWLVGRDDEITHLSPP